MCSTCEVAKTIEDVDQARRRRVLVVGGVVVLVVAAIVNGVLNSRADDDASALRSDVEQSVADLGDVAPTDFWILDDDEPPLTASNGRSMLVTKAGAEPVAMSFDQGQTFVLYRVESWGKERCVRVVFSVSGVEMDDGCVLIDRAAS